MIKMRGCKSGYSLPLVCIHLGSIPCVRSVTKDSAGLSFGAIVIVVTSGGGGSSKEEGASI